MKIAAKLLSLVLISAAVLITGCKKKPLRPVPDQTVIGPVGAGSAATDSSLTPSDVAGNPDAKDLQTQNGVIDDGKTIRGLLQPVYFDFDKSALKASERAKLDEAIKYLGEHPDQRILFEGHCDWRGTAEYNLGLGDRRAGAAKTYVTGKGLPAAKIETLSKGSLDAAKNAPEDQMSKDRKVELVILKQ